MARLLETRMAKDSDAQSEQASEEVEESQSEAVLEDASSSESEISSSEDSSIGGAMAILSNDTCDAVAEERPQAYAAKTKTPMFLDPASKAYALADSGATNVTLNLKHLGKIRKKKVHATPVEMTLASGKVPAYLYRDEVFAEDVKMLLCPLRRISRNLEITIEWTKDHCLLVLQGTPLMRLLLKKGLHYLTETHFALIRRALRDFGEGMSDVNQLSY
eukprot:1691270-Amphidinium_carterae.1